MRPARLVAVLLFAIVACPRPSLAEFMRFVSYSVSGYVSAGNLIGGPTVINFGTSGTHSEISTVYDDEILVVEKFRESVTGTGGGFADGYVQLIGYSARPNDYNVPLTGASIISGLTATAGGPCERCGAGAGFNSAKAGVSAGWQDTFTIVLPGLEGTPIHVEGNLRFSGTTKAEVSGPTAVYCGGGCAYVYAEASLVSLPHRLLLAHSIAQSADNYRDFPGHFPNIDPDPVIPINMDLIIGQPFSFQTSLWLRIDGRASAGNLANMEADFRHTLAWGGITSVTNASTGEPITDWTVTSDSGFDYSRGVPEPTSTVLLTFGLCTWLVWARPRRRRS
jgi:hypothetical protein